MIVDTNDLDPIKEIIGSEHAEALRSVLLILTLVPASALDEAEQRLRKLEAVGPIIDPTAWRGGKLAANSTNWREVLNALRTVRQHLPSVI